MRIKEIIFSGKSPLANAGFKKLIGLLDHPNRKKYNDPIKLIKASGIQPGQTVLEIGCGSGFFTEAASQLVEDEGILYAIDFQPVAVEQTQTKVSELGLRNVFIKREDAMDLSFTDAMFDLVILYGVVPAPVISMKDISKEIYRVLKPGGTYAIWTMVPFWRPAQALKHVDFIQVKKENGVFQLRKV